LPPVGIWKDIRLEGYSQARLEQVHLRQEHTRGQVEILIRCAIQRWGASSLTLNVGIMSPNGELIEQEATFTSQDEMLVKVPIPNPDLWWPNGYGSQPSIMSELTLQGGASQRCS
jgi:beta-mannosidase